jgi:hypothetical protein
MRVGSATAAMAQRCNMAAGLRRRSGKLGLVECIVPAASLDDVVSETVAAILACGGNALRLQKELIGYWEDHNVSSNVACGIASFAEAWRATSRAG